MGGLLALLHDSKPVVSRNREDQALNRLVSIGERMIIISASQSVGKSCFIKSFLARYEYSHAILELEYFSMTLKRFEACFRRGDREIADTNIFCLTASKGSREIFPSFHRKKFKDSIFRLEYLPKMKIGDSFW